MRVALAAALCCVPLAGCGDVSAQPPPDTKEQPRPALTSAAVVLEEGGTLGGALEELHVGWENGVAIAEAVEAELGVRTLRPGDSIVAWYAEGETVGFEVQRRLSSLVLVKAGERFAAGHSRPNFKRSVAWMEGEIETSLYFAIIDQGEKPGLLIEFADLFAYDIDFTVETRKGDRFALLYERVELVDTPVTYGRVLYAEYRGEVSGEHFAYYFIDPEQMGGYYTPDGKSLKKQFLRSPLKVYRVSSGFSNSRLHPILKVYRPHHGVDFSAPRGTPVHAVANGRVTYSGWKGGYGRYVSVKHNNGFTTEYAHMSKIAPGVRVGAVVRQGTVVGYVGSSGLSTGPHLHFGMKRNGAFIDPYSIKIPPVEPIKEVYMPLYQAHREKVETFIGALTQPVN